MELRLSKIIMIGALVISLLSGCSLMEGINNSLDYVDEATAYINDAAVFADKVRVLAEQMSTDPEARSALKEELETMKEKVIHFNATEVPALAKKIHEQLVSYNDKLLNEINIYLEKINDHVDFEALKDTQIIQTIDQITQLLQQLEQLGL
jgi:ABC-type transporter Mla subunit MlaD